jgi:release factor glutamine methyltransferase
MTDQALVEQVDFAGLDIRFDGHVLRPRQWTAIQSTWAAELLTALPGGAVLELCCGAGQIGLAAVRRGNRTLVCVDSEPAAVRWTEQNAKHNGLADRVDVRCGELDGVLGDEETFALVIADPPWVPSAEVWRWPDDPPGAIDGGPDGLAVARRCLEVAVRHLVAQGAVLLQLGSVEQADDLRGCARGLGLLSTEVRMGTRGVVALYHA